MTRARLTVVALVIGGCAALLVGVPSLAVCAAVALLVVLCRRRVRAVGPEGRRDLRYFLCVAGTLYLIPIGLALLAYSVLEIVVVRNVDAFELGTLLALENGMRAISTFFSDHLKLDEWTVLSGLLAVHVLGALLLRNTEEVDDEASTRVRAVRRLQATAEFYTRYSGPVAAGLATLAALSLFGMNLGAPTEHLKLRVVTAREGHAEVAARAEADLAAHVADRVWNDTLARFPASYRVALQSLGRRNAAALELNRRVESARVVDGIAVPGTADIVTSETERMRRTATFPSTVTIGSDDMPSDVPSELTPRQIDEAREASRRRLPGPAVTLVDDGRRRVVLQVEKLLSERLVALTKPLSEVLPILDPVVQAFAEALDMRVQQSMAQAYDHVMRQAMRDPDGLTEVIRAEASRVAAGAVTELSPEQARLAVDRAEEMRLTTERLVATQPLVDRQVAAHRARVAEEARAAAERAPRTRVRVPVPFPRPIVPPLITPRLPAVPRPYFPPARPVIPPRPVTPRVPGRIFW